MHGLYMVKSGNYYKVGSSADIDRQLKQYTCYNPCFRLLDTKRVNRKGAHYRARVEAIERVYRARLQELGGIPQGVIEWVEVEPFSPLADMLDTLGLKALQGKQFTALKKTMVEWGRL